MNCKHNIFFLLSVCRDELWYYYNNCILQIYCYVDKSKSIHCYIAYKMMIKTKFHKYLHILN